MAMRSRSNIVTSRLGWLGGALLVLAGSGSTAAAQGERTLLEQHGGLVLLIVIALVLQAAAIGALLLANRRGRQAEMAVRQQLSEIAHMNRMAAAGELSASISHEIKQPLAAIAANASAGLRWLARATPDLGEARAALQRIVDDAHRASDVIGTIRAMFKQGGEDRTPVDVNALIREVLALVRVDLEKRRVTVETDLPAGLPAVLGCPAQLQQVVMNVVTNAIEAMDAVVDGARTLRVTSRPNDPDGVLITVEDSGQGIDPRDSRQIFEPFYTTKSHGMGLGLSICRSIVEAHGGRLSASPGSLHGLALRISLPAGEAARA